MIPNVLLGVLLDDLVGDPVVLFSRLHYRLLSAVYVLRQKVTPEPALRHRPADRKRVVLQDQIKGACATILPWTTPRLTRKVPVRAAARICWPHSGSRWRCSSWIRV